MVIYDQEKQAKVEWAMFCWSDVKNLIPGRPKHYNFIKFMKTTQ